MHSKPQEAQKAISEMETFPIEILDGVNAIMNLISTWLLLGSMGVSDDVIADFVLPSESLGVAKATAAMASIVR